ncbi:MAG: hypothetical protein JO113_06385 [Candidatus Eremiobacteraeota bacterium]|nr:hypothetical protein [Candidatus Eremiobacteraeota bacterium]
MSRAQHLAGPFAALLTLLPICVAAQPVQTPSAEAIVALVTASPQLRIDSTIFSSGFDAKTHPYVNVRNAPEGTIGGYLVPEGANAGTQRDGTYVLAVPLDSGGSGGIFTQIIFAGRSAQMLAYAGFVDSGGHLSVSISDGAIVAQLPYYGDDSPNCCPKKYVVRTYTVRSGSLVKLSERFEAAKDE